MSRTLVSAVAAQAVAATLYPVVLTKFEFDSGDLNLWSGYNTITVESDVFTGVGELGTMTPIIETETLKATGMEFGLSAIDSTIIGLALDADYQERPVTCWLGFLDDDSGYLGRVQIFKGRMDTMNLIDNGDTSSLSVTAEHVLVSLEKTNERRYTAEDQKLEFPGDLGFDQVNALQNLEVVWGKT